MLAASGAAERGEGLVIAVSALVVRNAETSDEWMSQYFQDSLTGSFARYSAMTVLDRSNEKLILAEQKLSESAIYDDSKALELGKLTAARLVVAGTIQKIGAGYEVSFRVNDIETNEIRAAFSTRFSLAAIESGEASGKAASELLSALGVKLSAKEKESLERATATENESVQSLAKGAAAEKGGNYIEALLLYDKTEGAEQKEAQKNAQALLSGTFSGKNAKERLAFYQAQIDKWNAIFSQLEAYMNESAATVVYDFSSVADSLDMKKNTVSFTVTPGVKLVPNGEAMRLWARILNSWKAVTESAEAQSWIGSVPIPLFGVSSGYGEREKADRLNSCYELHYIYEVKVGLFDDGGNRIKEATVKLSFPRSDRAVSTNARNHQRITKEIVPKSQKKYSEEAAAKEIVFSGVKLEDVTENMSARLIEAKVRVWLPRSEREKEYKTAATSEKREQFAF